MQFHTKIPVQQNPFPFDYNAKIMSLGSCFAVNMASKLEYYQFQNSCNPFGIIFNPVSIEKLVRKSVNKEEFTEKDIFFHNDLWHCFDIHSKLSNQDKDIFLKLLNQLIFQTNKQITDSTHFIITFGTSWVYRNKENSEIVANCHKLPQKQFTKEILSIETIHTAIQNTFELIKSVNPAAKFIVTVSPVRHIKDGFVENQRSKAHLISGIHQLLNNEQWKRNIHYFPSYEIMIDELRDYRFYAEDMLHPNALAINYIWDRFKDTSVTEEVFGIMNEVENIQRGLAHRAFNSQSESHLKFEANLKKKITKLESQYPFMKF